MLTLDLSIRSQTRTVLPIHAQFVIGESSQEWVDEIVRWNVDDFELRLIIVPRSRRDLKPIGALVFYSDGSPLEIPGRCLSNKTVGYGLVGTQVYLPIDATIKPAISQQEIPQHLTPDRTYVWHPTAGLVAADASELLSVNDLFSMPEQIPQAWDEAQCGTAWARQLTSVALLPEASPTATGALEGGKGDIGSMSNEIKSIDPVEDPDGQTGEPSSSSFDKAMNAGVSGFAKFIQGVTGMVSRVGTNNNWVNKLEVWAANKLEGMSEKLEQQRFKELFRLQKLLEQDPEKGLQYALPLNSKGLSRGTAAPSSQLRQNQTNFSLSGLQSGGPTDYWNVPDDLRTKLNRQYRELAEREINLGRYRRAAYIYGELLADLNAAARTLEAGKHYREAAVLYRTKLSRDVDAARCLEKGGLWSELIALREELKQYEMAGDVYIQLGLEEQANAAFVRAVSQQVKQQNYIDAARIEEHKLKNLEGTLAILEKGWSASDQGNLCLQATFRLLGDAGRHDDSKAWVERVEEEFPVAKPQLDVLKTVAGLANEYPDQATREVARESTFRIVSTELIDKPNFGRHFLNSIAALHPEDKLLLRDCSKFKSQFGSTTTSPFKTQHPKHEQHSPTLVTTFSLPDNFDWVDSISLGDGYLLIGQKNQHVTIVKLSADFKTLGKQTGRLSKSSPAKFLIAKTLDEQRVIVDCPLDEQFGDQVIFATDEVPDNTIVGSSWIDRGTIGIVQGQNHQWIVVRITDANECLLEILSSEGALVSSKPLDFDFDELLVPIPICFIGSQTYLAMGQSLISVTAAGSLEAIDFGQPIRSIRGSERGTLPRIALSFDNGVQVLWNTAETSGRPIICQDLFAPETLFTLTGHLVVAADRHCEIYKTVDRQVRFVATFEIEPCVRLMRCSELSCFALLTESGKICVYRIPVK